jgi:thiamine-monophosphate kinase
MDEFGLIARHFAPIAASEPGALGLRDDAAVLDLSPGARLVCTKDALVAGVHFLDTDPPADIARKLMRVNLSDLAAMGARPRGVLLAAVLPRSTTDEWLGQFAQGLAEDAQTFAAPLVGGDTVATDGPLVLTLTALGEVGAAGVLTRSGAQAGDDIYVSGTIGDGMLGLRALTGGLGSGLAVAARDHFIARYRAPEPRLGLGQKLIGLATACIDISDGLIADLGHICETSGVSARITAVSVPISSPARTALAADPGLFAALLGGGDDYELLFTAPPSGRDAIAGVAQEAGVPVTRIGAIAGGGAGVEISDAEVLGIDLKNAGFKHFKDE